MLGPRTTTANPHEVELLLPPTGNNVQYDLDEGQKVTGIVTLNGVVHAWTFALSREPLHHALLDLKVFPCFSLHFFLQDSEEVSEKFSPVSHQV
jgi:hypothetical protein